MNNFSGWFEEDVEHPSLAQSLEISPAWIERFGATCIEALNLSNRSYNGLARCGLHTVQELLAASENDLFNIRNLGHSSVEEIKKRMRDYFAHAEEIPLVAAHNIPGSLAQRLKIAPATVEQFATFPITRLKLPPRAQDGLLRHELNHLGTLMDVSEEYLLDIRNLGFTSVEHTKARLRHFFSHPHLYFDDTDTREQFSMPAPAPVIANWPQLKPLVLQAQSLLWWSVPAFLGAWHDLPEAAGDVNAALQQRRALLENSEKSEHTLDAVLEAMRAACAPREWEVLTQRYALNANTHPQTLQEVAALQKVSRERVRQMEGQGQKKIRKLGAIVDAFNQSLQWIFTSQGGVLCLEHLEGELSPYFKSGQHRVAGLCGLCLQTFPEFASVARTSPQPVRDALCATRGPIFRLTTQTNGNHYQRVIETARQLWIHRETTLHSENWTAQIAQQLRAEGIEADESFIGACLRADGRFDPGGFEKLEVSRTLEQALVETLGRLGAPTHFSELAVKVNQFGFWKRDANVHNVHNRLVGHPELFVCIARGTYGLAGWGLEAQRRTRDLSVLIGDAAQEFLEARGEAAHEDEIVAYVLAQKKCRDFSIRQRLFYDKRFHRFAPHIYGLKKWVF